tara:strand:+ start:418 stop:660 length:243 start_codon:yes stop_codon:yes gene_type:complete
MENVELGAVVIGLTGAIRQMDLIPSKWLPLIAVIIASVLSAGIASGNGQPILTAVINGVIVGGTATGLVKTTGEIVKKAK